MTLRTDSVALVTGAARGLGWGIARAFGFAGARVCVTDIHDDELGRCARDLAADGTDFLSCRSDVADLADCKHVVERIVDVLNTPTFGEHVSAIRGRFAVAGRVDG